MTERALVMEIRKDKKRLRILELFRDERGDMLQYVLIACLIAVVCIVPFTKLGKGIAKKVNEIAAYLTGEEIPAPPNPNTPPSSTGF